MTFIISVLFSSCCFIFQRNHTFVVSLKRKTDNNKNDIGFWLLIPNLGLEIYL